MPVYRILTINPGSTSTKVAVFNGETPVFYESVNHTMDEISQYKTVLDQFNFRKQVVLNQLRDKGVDTDSLSAVVGRGGLIKPMEGGTYIINDEMVRDLKAGVSGQHVTNLGGLIADDIAKELKIPAFVVDPPIVDELEDVARLSGMPEIQRRSIFHALNQKAVAKRYARENGMRYEDLNLIVAHMGGGISVGAHKKGRVVDVNNALEGEGPFSPERSGSLPVGDLIRLCYSGKYTMDEILKKIVGKGGLVAYLGTNDARKIARMVREGDSKAELIFKAMAYQVAKEIGYCAAALYGKVDAILLTGGLAYSDELVGWIKERVEFISNVVVYPGEDEMLALAQGGLRVLMGEERAKEYK